MKKLILKSLPAFALLPILAAFSGAAFADPQDQICTLSVNQVSYDLSTGIPEKEGPTSRTFQSISFSTPSNPHLLTINADSKQYQTIYGDGTSGAGEEYVRIVILDRSTGKEVLHLFQTASLSELTSELPGISIPKSASATISCPQT